MYPKIHGYWIQLYCRHHSSAILAKRRYPRLYPWIHMFPCHTRAPAYDMCRRPRERSGVRTRHGTRQGHAHAAIVCPQARVLRKGCLPTCRMYGSNLSHHERARRRPARVAVACRARVSASWHECVSINPANTASHMHERAARDRAWGSGHTTLG